VGHAAAHAGAAHVGGADDADLNPAGELLVDDGAEEDVGVASVLFGHGGHDVVDAGQGELGPADDVDQQAVGLAGKLGGVEQRALFEALDDVGHGVLAGAGAEAEERLATLLGERLAKRGVIEVDQPVRCSMAQMLLTPRPIHSSARAKESSAL
jgi:hypothetical protein